MPNQFPNSKKPRVIRKEYTIKYVQPSTRLLFVYNEIRTSPYKTLALAFSKHKNHAKTQQKNKKTAS